MTTVSGVADPAPAVEGGRRLARPLDFEIVPRAGLIVVAVVFIALIVAIAANKLWPLTFLHVAVRRRVDDHRPVPRPRARADPGPTVDPGADRARRPS